MSYEITHQLVNPYEELISRSSKWKSSVLSIFGYQHSRFEDIIPSEEWFNQSAEMVNEDYVFSLLLGFINESWLWEGIARYLITGEYDSDDDLLEYIAIIDDADFSFEEAPPIDKSIKVMHGHQYGHYSNLEVGDEIQFKQYLNTTLDPGMALDYTEKIGGVNCCLFIITLPSGTRCIYTSSAETGIMLPRGSRIVINYVSEKIILETRVKTYEATLI